MLSIMKETCIKFVPWTGQGPVAAITKGPYCYASVGFDLDPQVKLINELSFIIY